MALSTAPAHSQANKRNFKNKSLFLDLPLYHPLSLKHTAARAATRLKVRHVTRFLTVTPRFDCRVGEQDRVRDGGALLSRVRLSLERRLRAQGGAGRVRRVPEAGHRHGGAPRHGVVDLREVHEVLGGAVGGAAIVNQRVVGVRVVAVAVNLGGRAVVLLDVELVGLALRSGRRRRRRENVFEAADAPRARDGRSLELRVGVPVLYVRQLVRFYLGVRRLVVVVVSGVPDGRRALYGDGRILS